MRTRRAIIALLLPLFLPPAFCRSPGLAKDPALLERAGMAREARTRETTPDWTAENPPVFAALRLEQRTYLIENATILTAAGKTIRDGSLLIEAGRIRALGSGKLTVEAPAGATRIDAKGKFITPGLIDTHSHLGVYPVPSVRPHSDGNEATGPITADVRAEDAIWPQDPGLQRALAGGVTTIQVLPGSANLIGGAGVTLKLHPARSARAMFFPGAKRGLKMACGENPKRVYGGKGRRPSTRMGSQALWRSTFTKAIQYRRSLEKHRRAVKKWESSAKDGEEPPADKKPFPPKRDFVSETLLAAMRGDILVHVHCYRADEMIRVLELAREYDFRVRSFHHAIEAYKIRDVLAAEKVSVSTWADWWGFKLEALDMIPQNAALVAASGGRAIIHSDSPLDIQRLNQEAAKAYHAGKHAGLQVNENEALRWITANPAWALGIEGETGTLETGKMADLVVWSRHPFSVYAKAEKVFVDGVLEFDAARPGKTWSDFEAAPGDD